MPPARTATQPETESANADNNTSVRYVDMHRRASVDETLWLQDDLARASYTVTVEVRDTPSGLPRVELRLQYSRSSQWEDMSSAEIRIDIPGGEQGTRAFVDLIERVTRRAKALGDLQPLTSRLDAETDEIEVSA